MDILTDDRGAVTVTRDMITGGVRTMMQALYGLVVSALVTIPAVEELGLVDALSEDVVVPIATTITVGAVYWLISVLSERFPVLQRLFVFSSTPTYQESRV